MTEHTTKPKSKPKVKISVYTICKNEESFVDRWVDSMQEADEIVVLDTGSTDGTVERLRARGARVEVGVFKPWRFDVPRNTSMQLVSSDTDVCVCTDLDEILTPGWRAALEKTWLANGGKVGGVGRNLRVRYLYTWNFNPDGSPGITFWYEKITPRNGYRWIKPVHEILASYVETEGEVWVNCPDFQLHHFPDSTKSRSSYLPLLEMSVRDEPDDDRNAHYLGREYMYYGLHDKAIAELVRHLSLPKAQWNAERSASMRFISKCFVAKGNLFNALEWALKACAEDQMAREPWLQLANVFKASNDTAGVFFAASKTLAIKSRPDHYINEPDAWSSYPYELAANTAFELGMIAESRRIAKLGLDLYPNNESLKIRHLV
jgi:glycosyltransferase involved in cell wall biosynthesis